ncbi:SIK1 [Symbiodinium sp. CCMP2456]|nr:SIK1 [Symbiodinium sp. CCMP2456]
MVRGPHPLQVVLGLCVACLFRTERPGRDLHVLSVDEDQGSSQLSDAYSEGEVRGASSTRRQPPALHFTCPDHEDEAAAVMHLALGVSEHRLQGHHCSWPGIGCDPRGCIVAILAIQVQDFPGELRGPCSHLRHLLHVVIRSEHLSGDIQEFATCKALRTLEISGASHVSGDIQALQDLQDLRDVSLRGTRVSGDIQVFQALVKLESLDLGATQVSGDIQAFQATPKLNELFLSSTQVVGDIQVFQKNKELTVLSLALTGVSGDIEVFNSTELLTIIQMTSTRVWGDIVVFQRTPHLQKVDLTSTAVSGDTRAFASHRKLENILMGNTGVHGDIAVFNASGISRLKLQKTQVFGNISALRALPRLQVVSFTSTAVVGDIVDLKQLDALAVFECHGTHVGGDVQAFEHLQSLVRVVMSLTNVTGDIEVFANKPALYDLQLASSRVVGDVGVLMSGAAANQLELLDLSSTRIVGNMWVFKDAPYLKELYLAGTQVTGSMDGIIHLPSAEIVDFSDTLVTGRLTRRWRGKARKLRTLKLSGSRVHFLPIGDDRRDLLQLLPEEKKRFLPALTTLEVSDCQLNGPASDLLRPLAACDHLGSVLAARAGLTDELPSLDPLPPTSRGDGVIDLEMRSPLATSLEVLDLSGNNLSFLAAIPPACHTLVVVENMQPLHVAAGELAKALRRQVVLDMRETILHNDSMKDVEMLLSSHDISRTVDRTNFRTDKGYACFDLDRSTTTLEITPAKLMPEKWCSCLPGWHGTGINCSECSENTFSTNMSSPSCTACPANSTSPKRSKSVHECKCQRGSVRQVDSNTWICGCPPGRALLEDSCVSCEDRHLNCSSKLSDVKSAEPLTGFARLQENGTEAFQCLVAARCPGGKAGGLGCESGYAGPLCMACSETYFEAGRMCIECSEGGFPRWLIKAGVCLMLGVLLCACAAAVAYFVDHWSPGHRAEQLLQYLEETILGEGVLGNMRKKLLKNEIPLLIQMCQLWVVVAAFASAVSLAQDETAGSGLWELPYMETLQLTVENIQELLYLQCYFGGARVRLAFGLLAPMLPLLLLFCCLGLEFFNAGAGVNAALKILTLFFIGGASKCFSLQSCQRFDAGGEKLADEFAFLRQLPDLRCNFEASPELHTVVAVFWPCAICYSILIPCFLIYLYLRQHKLLHIKRAPLQVNNGNKDECSFYVAMEERMLQKRLTAAAVAYVAVLQKRNVRVQLREGKGMVTLLDGTPVELDVNPAHFEFQQESDRLRHHAITEMLVERLLIEEEGKNDRVLRGAKELLFKYGTCRDLWMEVVLKLVAVALVNVVSAAQVASSTEKEVLLFAVGKVVIITLGMAFTVWMVQPYGEPQVNDLQLCCFLSLAASAVGFGFRMLWLSRLALLAPLLLSAWHTLQPDSPESLAWRLWEGLQKDAPEAHVLGRPQSVAMNFKLES